MATCLHFAAAAARPIPAFGRHAVNRRAGDRRVRKRFEIVGTLTGTLETWQLLAVRNLSATGALVETRTPFAAGDRINGRVLFQGRGREVRGEVRRVTTRRGEKGEKWYPVVFQWTGTVEQMDELLAAHPRDEEGANGQDVERRRSHRVNSLGRAEIGQPRWTTVDVLDISGSGVMFVSRESLTVGEKARLKVRLGEHSLTAEIEVRREDTFARDRNEFRVGASFVALDEAARVLLEEFVGDRRQ